MTYRIEFPRLGRVIYAAWCEHEHQWLPFVLDTPSSLISLDIIPVPKQDTPVGALRRAYPTAGVFEQLQEDANILRLGEFVIENEMVVGGWA